MPGIGIFETVYTDDGSLAITLVVAQITAAPVHSPPAVPTGWTAATLGRLEYFRVTRTEGDGSAAILAATSQVCDCQPIAMQTMVANALLHASRGVAVKLDSITVCGQPGQRMAVTGLADATHKNLEELAFRVGGTFYGLNYSFTAAAPNSTDEATLLTLCPRITTGGSAI